MQPSLTEPRDLTIRILSKIKLIATLIAACALLQACGGGVATVGRDANPKLVAIQINPSNSLVPLAANRQLQAVGIYDNGGKRDITQGVTWSVTSANNSTNFVSVDSKGVASGLSLGTSIITASQGPVQGATPLTVNTNGYTSNTLGILTVLLNRKEVDAAYLPQSQTSANGVYTIQAVNLDADSFSSAIPVPSALISSIPLPAGFVPNLTVASQNTQQVAVISYTSPTVQLIDATNTVISSFVSPITQSTNFNGITCMICAAVINPSNDQIILSTSQGYYTMDLKTGMFAPLPSTPAASPSENFFVNPVAVNPFLLSPTPGSGPHSSGEVQFLDLTTDVAAPFTWELSKPNAAAIDLYTNYGIVTDSAANQQALVNLVDPQNLIATLVSNTSVCAGVPAAPPAGLNMVALGIGVGSSTFNTPHTVFLSQPSGNCVGFETWPNSVFLPLDPTQMFYGYGALPATPDGVQFVNGADPNVIATFTSVVDKKNYGILVNATQDWIAKLNLGTLSAQSFAPIPEGQDISGQILAGAGGDPLIYLPVKGVVALSPSLINFGNQDITTSNPIQVGITLKNTSTKTLSNPHIAVRGSGFDDFTLMEDFAQTNNCGIDLPAQSQCTITVTFTPADRGLRSGSIIVSFEGASPQDVPLAGTGT